MNKYEILLDEANDKGLIVKEKSLQSSNGRIKGNRIAIRKDLKTTAEKACVLAEELGHYETTVGDILEMSSSWNRKQERQARLNGYNRMIGVFGIIRAYEAGCQEYLLECIECYRDKYGEMKSINNYIVYFIPNLAVIKIV